MNQKGAISDREEEIRFKGLDEGEELLVSLAGEADPPGAVLFAVIARSEELNVVITREQAIALARAILERS